MIVLQNHPIERIWGEVNQRVNFPIKAGLKDLVDKEILDLNDEISKFSVSAVAIEISRVGMTSFVEAWNAHPISGNLLDNLINNLKVKYHAKTFLNLPFHVEVVFSEHFCVVLF